MKLIELIPYLETPKLLDEFCKQENLNIESEALLLYMLGTLDLESEIVIFEIEETEGRLVFEKEGHQYVQLFPLSYAAESIEFDLDLKNKNYSADDIARRLLDYRINDA